jgi:iron complex outermembrane receptor protein
MLAATVSLIAIAGQAAADDADKTVAPLVVTAPRTTGPDTVASVDKTGTPIQDLPRSVQVVPDVLFHQQGAVTLTDTLRDVSGAAPGGQFAFGFFDRVIVRGLNVTYLNDGLPDGTSDLTGVVHSLVGVERVEVLKGPGSALYGDTEEGGAINLVHYRPSDTFGGGISEQAGSFDSSATDAYLTGPTGIANLDWRVDAEYQISDGFRGLGSRNQEALGALSWRPDRHDVELRLDVRHVEATPDSTGIPFSPPNGVGLPLNVPADDRYYTPYANAAQDIGRVDLSDAWTVSDLLTVNLRGAYSHRDTDILRNAGGSVKLIGGAYQLAGRQLRRQEDRAGDLNLQAEPTWHFSIGGMNHLLVTGFEARAIDATTERQTADLPNIVDIFSPMVTDGPLSSLTFMCDASHSCDDARLSARLYGLYAIDQIDVTDKLKLRLSARQDWFDTRGEARALLPVNGGQEQPCVPPSATACPWIPGQPVERNDSPISWDVGAVYFLTPGLSAFAGYSSDAYPIFNTEEPESIGQVPERGTQVEVGARAQKGAWLSLSSSLYRVTRENVFTLLVEPDPGNPAGNIDVAQVFSYRVQGWETDLNLRPAEPWNLLVDWAVQDGEITRYPQAPADIGHAPPSVPSFLANAFTTYETPVPIGALQFSFGVRYRNHEWADANQTRQVPGVPLLDAGLSLMHDRWTLSGGVQNLADRRNFLYGDGTGGGALPGAGRTGWVRLGARF